MVFVIWLVLTALSFPDQLAAGSTEQPLTARAAAPQILPAPIVVQPSQDFVGSDGPWSSFELQIGSPAQNVQVFPSTAGYQTWAVVPQGCTSSDPPNCATLRGGQFVPSQSSSWTQNNVTTNGTFSLEIELNLGYSGNGLFGYDTVALGFQGSGGPSLDQQIVAGIATPEFYLGAFGLNPRPTNFTNYNHPVPSYMANLKQRSMIPSLSWSYTAGNQYRLNKALGSLTLGGYDTSKFVPNDLTFAFNAADNRDLVVNIQQISFATSSTTKSLSTTSIPAFVDSTIPYFYLPLNICQQFESAFGITWDDQVQAYLVNDTLHTQLQNQNATVTFTLTNSSSTHSVNISLPYAAFDLTATYPLLTNSSGYFPLMRASNATQYTLGRAFLQEAYLIADYERHNFSVSQCNWNADAQQNIIPIKSLSTNSSSSTNTSPTEVKHGLSAGAIAGIVIGGLAGLLLVFAIALILKRRQTASRKAQAAKEAAAASQTEKQNSLDGSGVKVAEIGGGPPQGHEMDGFYAPSHEIDSKKFPGHELHSQKQIGAELEGQKNTGHELGGSEPSHELGGDITRFELPAVETPGSEMAVPDAPVRTPFSTPIRTVSPASSSPATPARALSREKK